MVDKILNIDNDSFWDEIDEVIEQDQPPSKDDGWFTITEFAERFGMTYDKAKRYLASMSDKFEKTNHKYWVYFRLRKDD